MNSKNIAEMLNDLVQINNDRIAVYTDAITQLEEGYDNLRELFKRMIDESKIYNNELTTEIGRLNEPVAEGTSGAGKLYRAWMDVKVFISGGSVNPILEACEAMENATQKTYEEMLDQEGLSGEVHILISKQKSLLLESHAQIKQLIQLAKN